MPVPTTTAGQRASAGRPDRVVSAWSLGPRLSVEVSQRVHTPGVCSLRARGTLSAVSPSNCSVCPSRRQIPSCRPKARRDILRGLAQLWTHHFDLDADRDIPFELGRLHFALREYVVGVPEAYASGFTVHCSNWVRCQRCAAAAYLRPSASTTSQSERCVVCCLPLLVPVNPGTNTLTTRLPPPCVLSLPRLDPTT